MASDFVVTAAKELLAGVEPIVVAGLEFGVVVCAELDVVDVNFAVLALIVPFINDTLLVLETLFAFVVVVMDALTDAVPDVLVSLCTGPVPVEIWYRDSKH